MLTGGMRFVISKLDPYISANHSVSYCSTYCTGTSPEYSCTRGTGTFSGTCTCIKLPPVHVPYVYLYARTTKVNMHADAPGKLVEQTSERDYERVIGAWKTEQMQAVEGAEPDPKITDPKLSGFNWPARYVNLRGNTYRQERINTYLNKLLHVPNVANSDAED